MVNENKNESDDVEVTNDEYNEIEDTDLAEEEERSADKIKKQRDTIARLKEEKQTLQDDLQRTKAEFLNARKRLEDERARDRVRSAKRHVEELLPLCDSFQMAMNNQEVWEKADESWRKGIEGIYTQLKRILDSYQVTELNPVGDAFNPHTHEAIGTEVVTDEKLQDTIVSVVQRGYEIKVGDTTELIRPARVTTGVIENND